MKILTNVLLVLALFSSVVSAEEKKPTSKKGKKKQAHAAEKVAFEPATADHSILRVNVASQGFNQRIPWQKENPSTRRGLGALLPKGRVLATAQLVADANYIEIELPASGRKATAEVVGIDYEANLAVLKLTDEGDSFFDGMVPFELDTSATVGDGLEALQIESNGTGVSTPITISQAEISTYFLPGHAYLVYRASGVVQYRAGSFTLPVSRNGKLAGLLIRYSSEQQVSTILPAPVIQHFLNDLEDGEYDGFPSFGIEYATTLDEQLRDYLGMKEGQGGVYVSAVIPGASAEEGGMEMGDVILSIDGHDIDSRGNFDHPLYGLLNLSHLIRSEPYVGSKIAVKILRNKKVKNLEVTVVRKPSEDYIVDPYMFDRGGKYLLMGGVLLQELTRPYLTSFGEDWRSRAPFKLVYAASHPEEYEEEGREKIVFLGGVLPSLSTQGYEGLGGAIVDSINGVEIGSIKDAAKAFEEPNEDGLHEIKIDGAPNVIWLDPELVQKDNFITLPQRYRVPELNRLD